MSAPPFAPPFALPVPDPPEPAAAPPRAASGRERARAVAAAGALGATAIAATLALASGMVVFEQDVVEVIARPASVADGVSVQALRDLATLPGPSPLVIAALLPAIVLLILAGLLRRLGRGAPPLHGVSPEALGAAERTLGWAVRAIVVGALLVFVVPALLQVVGIRAVSLTTGSMAPAYPAGSLLLVTSPADPARISVGEVVVIAGADGSRLTHRVVAVVPGAAGQVAAYRTRGDAVPAVDPGPVVPGDVDGVAIAGVPVLGAMRAWMASPLGIVIGVVLAWSLATGGALLADDRRRALAACSAGSIS
jgi:signal peptidase